MRKLMGVENEVELVGILKYSYNVITGTKT